MHANPVTLAVCGSQCRNRGWAARGGSGQILMTCSDAHLKPGKDTPTDPERKAVCGFQQRWHSQVPAYNAITAATMGHNYSTSTPSVSDVLMASSLARSRECTEKFSLCRFRSGTFDLKNMASSEK